jgi:DsbC/DsbD-like thiol-disulfide interchange protein
MKRNIKTRIALALITFSLLSAAPATRATDAPKATPGPVVFDVEAAPEPEPQANNVGVNGFFSVDPAQQGSTFQAAVVMEVPRGLHVNSNRPLGKYAVPTVVKVDAPRGFRVTPVTYPRGAVRTFSFGGAAAERLAVYEGRTIFRFNVSVPANHSLGVETVRVNVRFQSCSDEVCFPPATRELALRIAVVGRDTPSNRINGQYFGRGRR